MCAHCLPRLLTAAYSLAETTRPTRRGWTLRPKIEWQNPKKGRLKNSTSRHPPERQLIEGLHGRTSTKSEHILANSNIQNSKTDTYFHQQEPETAQKRLRFFVAQPPKRGSKKNLHPQAKKIAKRGSIAPFRRAKRQKTKLGARPLPSSQHRSQRPVRSTEVPRRNGTIANPRAAGTTYNLRSAPSRTPRSAPDR